MYYSSCVLLGDMMIDRSCHGVVSRMSPEAPHVPTILQTHAVDTLGGAGNLLSNISTVMGDIPITVLCKLGTPEHNDTKAIMNLLQRIPGNILLDHIIFTESIPTILKTRVFVEGRMVSRIDIEAAHELDRSLDAVPLTASTLLAIADYGGMCQGPHFDRLMQRAYEAQACIVVDPKQPDIHVYSYATIIKPNLHELLQFAVLKHSLLPPKTTQEVMEMRNEDLVTFLSETCEYILDRTHILFLFVTLGHRGLFLFSKDNVATYCPQSAVNVVDVVGAGDTTLAVLLSLLQKHGITGLHRDPMTILRYAGCGGRSAVQFCGNFHLTQVALSFIDRNLPAHKFIMCDQDFNWQAHLVRSFAETSKAQGKLLVVSNGCFDIVHSGHIHALIEAKEQGNIHIVAVNSDSSVKQLKGSGRPVNNMFERLRFLGSLPFVDFVVGFSETSPCQLYSHLKPSIIVKGSEYDGKKVAGEEFASRVHLVQQIAGVSTTTTIGKVLAHDGANC